MQISVEKTTLDGVLIITPDVSSDFRGTNQELYNEKTYADAGIGVRFVRDAVSISKKDVFRGIHGDPKTWKLISCLHGELYLVVVVCDEQSPDFGKWQGFTLTQENRKQVLVPPTFGNGHLALTDQIVFHYKWSHQYDRDIQFSYHYNDPRFTITLPIDHPILSPRDAGKEE